MFKDILGLINFSWLKTTEAKTEVYQVSKVLHYIWVGTKIMPEQSIDFVLRWAFQNPDVPIIIYVDGKSYLGGFKAIREAYLKKLEEMAQVPNDERIKNLIKDLSSPKPTYLQLKDIDSENLSDERIRYEIDRFYPNYGASSDLLRYKILSKMGGIYFDSDIEPTDINLTESGIFNLHTHHMLHYNSHAQGFTQSTVVCGDALASTPNNPDIMKLWTAATDITKNPKWQFPEYRMLVMYNLDKPEFRKEFTIDTTGPGTLVYSGVESKKNANVGNFIFKNKSLVQAANNTGTWLVPKANRYSTPEEALNMMLNSIKFEVKTYGFLRLDTHIGYLIKTDLFDQHEAVMKLLPLLDGELSSIRDKIEFIDISFHYPETVEFSQKNSLISKIPLWPDHDSENFKYALLAALSRDRISERGAFLLQYGTHNPLPKSDTNDILFQRLIDICNQTIVFLEDVLFMMEKRQIPESNSYLNNLKKLQEAQERVLTRNINEIERNLEAQQNYRIPEDITRRLNDMLQKTKSMINLEQHAAFKPNI